MTCFKKSNFRDGIDDFKVFIWFYQLITFFQM